MRRFLISALSLILVLISCEKELTPIQNGKEGTCSLEKFSILLSVATPKTYSTGAVDIQILALYE